MSLGKKKMQMQGAAGITATDHFAPVTYTGNGSTQSISSLDFQPDFIWFKNRDDTDYNTLYDSIRGAGKFLSSNTTAAEVGNSGDLLSSFDSNGFTVNNTLLGGSNTSTNGNNEDFVAWCWKAGGTAVSNTDGSITSTVSANTAAGFSIVEYSGNSTATQTIGHGLSSAPELIITKNLDDSEHWVVGNTNIGWTKATYLSSNVASFTNNKIYGVNPTSTVYTVSGGGFDSTNTLVNTTGKNYIAYCFHSVDGYQKIGTYTGTGSSGIQVTTGFQPRFIMVKASSRTSAWLLMDTERDTVSPLTEFLVAQGSGAEFSAPALGFGFNSTGFSVDNTDGTFNDSGETYIYLAIA